MAAPGDGGPSGRLRALGLVVPAIMLLVAGVHAVRVATVGQSPWQGGGFAMFATYDSDTTRVLVATADVDGEPTTVDTGAIPADLHVRARVTPTDPILLDVGDALEGHLPRGTDVVTVAVRRPQMTVDGVVFETVNAVTWTR